LRIFKYTLVVVALITAFVLASQFFQTGLLPTKTVFREQNKRIISEKTVSQLVQKREWGNRSVSTKAEPVSVKSIAIAPNSQTIAIGYADGRLQIGQVLSDTVEFEIEGHKGSVDSIAFSPDGALLAAGGSKLLTDRIWDDSVNVWRLSDRQLLHHFGEPRDAIAGCGIYRNSVAFSPDSALLASTAYDHPIPLWNILTGFHDKNLEGHLLAVLSVAFSPDGRLLASASNDDTVRIWDVASSELLFELDQHLGGATSVAFSPDGSLLATSAATGEIKLWRVNNEKLLNALTEYKNSVSNIVFSPDGSLLAAGADKGSINLWRVADGQLMTTLESHTARVNSVAFSADGEWLLSGAEDGTAKAWSIDQNIENKHLTSLD